MQNHSSRKSWKRYLPFVLGVSVVVVAIVVGLLLKDRFKLDASEPKKQIQQVTIVAPPPPPPPPPKEEIEEPEVEEEIPEEVPEDAAPESNDSEQAAGEELGVDAEGSAGGDGFGLIGKKGGRGLLGGIGAYELGVRAEINEAILEDEKLRRLDYIANLTLKLSGSGEIDAFKVELVSGDAEAKVALESLLSRKRKVSGARPLEAASSIKLRIRSVL